MITSTLWCTTISRWRRIHPCRPTDYFSHPSSPQPVHSLFAVPRTGSCASLPQSRFHNNQPNIRPKSLQFICVSMLRAVIEISLEKRPFQRRRQFDQLLNISSLIEFMWLLQSTFLTVCLSRIQQNVETLHTASTDRILFFLPTRAEWSGMRQISSAH